MRLVTRSDFDGLACAVLLKILGLIDEYKYAHPKDLQDGLIEITSNDILANVPFVPGCGIWFDHHSSESERLGEVTFTGMSKAAPSCARVIWEYYGGHKKFDKKLDEMLDAVDRVDSGMLTIDDINNPKGWVLLGYIMDPRTGLGRYRDYRISNYQLMLDMIDYCAEKSAEEILAINDVKERSDRYFEQETKFREMAKQHSSLQGNVLLLDLREQEEIYTSNRFTIYAMYPECNVSIQVMWGLKKQNTVFTVGYSILNRTCDVNVGNLMLKYGGGGHKQVGTCQVPSEKAEETLKELIAALQKN
ncbi:MAG: exopolyphosphatase [Syntrophorhabdaceae bacterium]|nr:exopolyphosphatase [Syntrophorhabdaceae bacterium]